MKLDRRIGEMEVTNHTVGTSQRSAAIAAGVGILIMAVAAMFATTVQESVIVPGDAAATANNILANEPEFRLAVFSLVVVVVLDVIVAWGLYIFLRPVNTYLSLLAAWFRVVYAAVFLITILNLGDAVRLLSSAGTSAVLEMDQLQAQATLMLNAFNDGWDLALALFGLHLILLGYLFFKAGYMRKILGALLVIAGVGYTFDAVTGFLYPSFGVEVSLFTFIGELLLAFWLVIKGASSKQWEKLALESA
jgi:hypothetical protein